MRNFGLKHRDPVEVVATSVEHLTEALAVILFISAIAVIAALGCGA